MNHHCEVNIPTTHSSQGILGVPETQSCPHCPSPIRPQSVTFTIWERHIRALGAVTAYGKTKHICICIHIHACIHIYACIHICTCMYTYQGRTQTPRRFLWRSYYGFPELPPSPASLQWPQDNPVPHTNLELEHSLLLVHL